MPEPTPARPVSLPAGAHLIGTAIGPFTIKQVPGKNGQTMQFIEGMVLAGMLVAKVTKRIENGITPYLPEHGDPVQASIDPSWKTNGVLVVEATISRPALTGISK